MSFLIPSGTGERANLLHLFVVCTDIDANGDMVLASISSWKNSFCDETCILEAGCHNFITQKSYVMYRKSRIENVITIQKGIEAGQLIPKDSFNSDVLTQIKSGLLISKHTNWRIKRHIKNYTKSD